MFKKINIFLLVLSVVSCSLFVLPEFTSTAKAGNLNSIIFTSPAGTINGINYSGNANFATTSGYAASAGSATNATNAGSVSCTGVVGGLGCASDNTYVHRSGDTMSGNLTINGLVTATQFSGNGANLTGITGVDSAINIKSGATGDLNAVWTTPGTSITNGLYVYNYGSSATNKPISIDNANWVLNLYSHPSGGTASYGHQIAGADSQDLYFRRVLNGGFSAWSKIWHTDNDGTGSGLDADLLDGAQPSALSVLYAVSAGSATNASNAGSVPCGGITGGGLGCTGDIFVHRAGDTMTGNLTLPVLIAGGGSSSNWASVNAGGTQSINANGSIYSYNSICVNNASGLCNGSSGVVLGLANTSASTNFPSSGVSFINNGSNVGIGKTNPATALDVNGTVTATQFVGGGVGLTGVTAANATYATTAGSATNCTNANYLSYSDNRAIAPKNFGHNLMAFGFGSYTNNSASPWADFIELNSYQDASGGNDNLLVINRNAFGARLYQQTYNSATAFSTYKDIVLAENSPVANYLPKYSGTGTSVSVANSRIFDNGTNVGIGTNNPGYTLDVNGALGVNGTISKSTAGGYFTLQSGATNGDIQFNTPNASAVQTRRFWVQGGSNTPIIALNENGGNVGIGTTNPGAKLEVLYPSGAKFQIVDYAGYPKLVGTGDWIFLGGTQVAGVFIPDADLTRSFGTAGRRFSAFYSKNLTDNGTNVGIGTTDPNGKLAVSNGGSEGIEFYPGYSGDLNVVQAYNRSMGIYNDLQFNARNFSFNLSGGSSSVYISSAGRVGIGSGLTAPTQPLQVAGNIYLSSGTFNTLYYGTPGVAAPGAGSVGEKIQLYGTAGTNSSNDYALGIENSNMWFNTGGGFKFYTSSTLRSTIDTTGLGVFGNISAYPSGDTGNNSDPSVLALGPNSTYAVYIKAHRYDYSSANGLDFYYTTHATGASALGMRLDTYGNVGIGTTAPSAMLTVNGNMTVGANKVTAGTFDPLYTINNKRYATYLSGMTGVKEETAGVISLDCSGKACSKTIDFNNLAEGSDLWLFSKVTNLKNNFAAMSVILTPNVSQPVWYEKDIINKTLTLKAGNTAHRTGTIEVSYRLTAPRFDSDSWKNTSAETEEGFNLDKLIK